MSNSNPAKDIKDITYGFFSMMAAERSDLSVNIYLNDKGEQVVVTFITTDPEGSAYDWPDKKCVGIVTQHYYTEKEDPIWRFLIECKMREIEQRRQTRPARPTGYFITRELPKPRSVEFIENLPEQRSVE